MKKFKLLMPILGITATAGLITPVAVACNKDDEKIHIDYEAVDEQSLLNALKNPEYKVIALADNITITSTDVHALEITRPVTIIGNNKTIKWDDATAANDHRLVYIDIANNNKQKKEVIFKDIKFEYFGSGGYSSTIHASHIDGCRIQFDHCEVHNGGIGQGKTYYALEISPENVNGSEIIINDSSFSGWSAIYNLGSNVKLIANDSSFYGDNGSKGDDEEFSTIVVSDFPMLASSAWNHCFSANNNFTFNDCSVYVQKVAGENNQFFVENRSAANNVARFNECEFSQTYGMDTYFLNVTTNAADIIDDNIKKILCWSWRTCWCSWRIKKCYNSRSVQ